MSPEKLIQATLFTLVTIYAVYYSDAVTAEPRSMVESPVLKEMEFKKSLYYNRKPVMSAPGKIAQNVKNGVKPVAKTPVRRAPTKPIHATPIRSANSETIRTYPSAASSGSNSGGAGGSAIRNEPSSTSTSVTSQATNSTGSNITETAASDRVFIPPYKMPFWGMPYGVYSNGGFINPGLFPFVPGGPGFPPYDGIFGSPFGPGAFPGNQSPFPKGTGTPMDAGPLPLPPTPFGQPPLNPTGRRSNGAPPGAFSPGSQMGYYFRRPTPKRPAPTKSKKKRKPKPEPDSDEDGGGGGGGGCGCNKKGKDHDHDAPSYSKRPRTTSTTPDPCPCGAASSAKPSYRKEPIDDEDDHYHHHHHDHSDVRYKPEPSPCPLATPPTTPTSTTPEYIPPPPPPPSTPAYEPSTETAPTTEYSSPTPSETTYKTRRPCRLRHKSPPSPAPQRIVYYDYDSPEPSQVPPPTRKPCPLKRQKNYERNDYHDYPSQSPPPPPAAHQPTPGAIYQASPSPLLQTQQYQPFPYQSPQPFQYQQPQPQYIAAHVPQESQHSQSTVLYKPIPQDIVHTPTSVTVPLPFPYVMDSNGMLQPQHHPNTMQNSQQVTYKVDLNQDLLAKITTPIVVSQSQSQQQHQYNHHNQPPSHQLSSTGNQYMLDGHPISISNSQILHSKAQPYVGQSSSPSVIVLNSDSIYDTRQQHYQQPQMYTATPPSSPVTVSYLHPSTTPSGIPGYSSTPSTSEYRILLSDSSNKNMESSRHQIQSNLPLPYRTLTSYQVDQPPRRSQHAITNNDEDSTLPNKNYVIIDRAELEELKKTFTSNDDKSPDAVSERNVPPPPDVVHIEFHSKMDDDKENSNKPLSFQQQSYNQRARRLKQQQPKPATNFVESATEPIAEGSTQFSRIFDLNNEDILSAGRKKSSIERDSGSNHATILRTSLVFDKYLKND